MAIQAQYPLIQHRNTQDGKIPFSGDDYSSMRSNYGGGGGEDGGGGTFFDHTNTSFKTGVWTNNSTRKRGREEAINDSPLISSMIPLDFVGLRHIFSRQKNIVSTGLGLAFHNHQPQQSLSQKSLLYNDPVSQSKQQNDEIDHLLIAQGEQMQRMLLDKRHRQYQTLLNAAEEVAARRLREKEAEVGMAILRQAELESEVNQIVLETQTWEVRARMQENYAVALNLQLQQAIMTGGGGGGQGGGNSMVGGEAEDAGSACIDTDEVVLSGSSCKSCRKQLHWLCCCLAGTCACVRNVMPLLRLVRLVLR